MSRAMLCLAGALLAAVAIPMLGCSIGELSGGIHGDEGRDGTLDGGGGDVPRVPSDGGGDTGGGTDGGSNGGPQAGLLTAGDVDDNLNFGFFTTYISGLLQSDSGQVLPRVNLAERITIRVVDPTGAPVPNARVRVLAQEGASPIVESWASYDGVFRYFPHGDNAATAQQVDAFTVEATDPGEASQPVAVAVDPAALDADRTVEVTIGANAALPASMDLVLVMDTTGSMSDELDYLTTEFRSIVQSVQSAHPGVDMRFGLVAYRDAGDEYVVRDFPFTGSVDTMRDQLASLVADAGGDMPEAVDEALEHAMAFDWRPGNTARALIHVADAPPHDENLSAALDQAWVARRAGVRVYPVAASGVDQTAEFMMRVSAALTHGRYMFLTDDSGVGNPHAEPTVPCYVVTRLDSLIVRVLGSELEGHRIEPTEDEIIRRVGNSENGVCVEQ